VPEPPSEGGRFVESRREKPSSYAPCLRESECKDDSRSGVAERGGDGTEGGAGPDQVVDEQHTLARDRPRVDGEGAFQHGFALVELAKVLQLSRARSSLRDRLHDGHIEATRQLVGDLVKRLNATRSGRWRGHDYVELDAPGADELLRDDADLFERRGVVAILQPVEQVPDFGATRVDCSWPYSS